MRRFEDLKYNQKRKNRQKKNKKDKEMPSPWTQTHRYTGRYTQLRIAHWECTAGAEIIDLEGKRRKQIRHVCNEVCQYGK